MRATGMQGFITGSVDDKSCTGGNQITTYRTRLRKSTKRWKSACYRNATMNFGNQARAGQMTQVTMDCHRGDFEMLF